MAYLVQKENSNIISVTYTGDVGLHERKEAVDEVCQLVTSSDPVRLLIDVRKISKNMSDDEQECFAGYLASKTELTNAKVAVVRNPINNPNKIINAVAYTLGYYTVEFINKTEAIAWLEGHLK